MVEEDCSWALKLRTKTRIHEGVTGFLKIDSIEESVDSPVLKAAHPQIPCEASLGQDTLTVSKIPVVAH